MSDIVIRMTIDAKQLQSSLDSVKNKITEVGARDVDIKTDRAEKKISSLRDSVAMWGLAIQGAANAFRMVGNAITSALAPASEFEQLRLRLNALYQDTELAAQAFERFEEIATKTPATLQQIVEAGAALKAYGMDAEETLASVADLAAYMGIDVVEAAQSVGRAFAGGAGAADVLRERGVLELIKSFKGIEDLTKLTLPEFREAMLSTMQDPAAGIAGTSATMADSFAGSISNMQDALARLAADIGQKVTPTLASLARAVGKVSDWFLQLSGRTQILLVSLPLATAAWHKLAAAKVTAATVSGGLTAAITAATAAVKGFLTTIGPIGWVLMGATAAVTAYSIAVGGAAEKQSELEKSFSDAEAGIRAEEMNFRNLADRLLELRSETDLTTDSKNEMNGIIKQMNSEYGEYLGNINLATASYKDLEKAITDATNALIAEKTAEAYGTVYKNAVEAYGNALQGVIDKHGMAFAEQMVKRPGRFFVTPYPEEIQAAVDALEAMAQAEEMYRKMIRDNPVSVGPNNEPSTPPGPSGAAALEKSYQTLMEKLRDYQRTEQEKIEVEYDEHMATILASTKEGSEERKEAIGLLNQWRADKEQELTDKITAEEEKAARAQAAIRASYYEEVTFADAGYYEWKKAKIEQEVTDMALAAEQEKVILKQRLGELEDARDEFFAEEPASRATLGWFWEALGFDPDRAEDQEKVRAAQRSFRQLQSSISSAVSMALEQNRDRRERELASIEETAERERWSRERLLRHQQEINAKYAKEEGKLKRIQKGISITQAVINTAEAVTKALTMGPILGPIMGAMMAALGAVQIKLIASQKFAAGGIFRGEGGPRDDRNIIAVSDGEYIVNAASTKRFKPILDALNFGMSGGTLLPDFAYASGGLVTGGTSLRDIAKKLDILNLNLVKKEMAVTVESRAGVETLIRRTDRVRPRMEKRGYSDTQSI